MKKKLSPRMKKILIPGLVFLILSLLFLEQVKDIIFILVLIGLAGISKVYHRFYKNYFAIDLVTFCTLLAQWKLGLVPALIVGWVGVIIADIVGTRIAHTTLISIIGLTVASFLFKLYMPLGFFYGSMLGVVTYEAVVIPLYFTMGSTVPRVATFLASHFLMNLLLFYNLGGIFG